MNLERQAQPLPSAPQAHGRAIIWLAQDALRSGEASLALDMIRPLLVGANPILISLQGDVLIAMNEFEGAVDVWARTGNHQLLIKAAGEAASAGLLDDAEMAYWSAWGINPIDGTLPLANFLWRYNDPSAAEDILRQSLAAYPSANLNWTRELGTVLRVQTRWDEAIFLYQQVLDEKPDDLITLRLIGEAYYLGKDDPDAAYDVFQTMLALAPEKVDGYFAIGQLLAHEGEYDEAEQWFIQALDRKSDDPWVWVVRGNTALKAQNLSLAFDIYDQAIQRFPDYAPVYYGMAGVNKLLDQPERAVHAIETALDLQKLPNAWYYVRAGAIYEWVGDRDLAIKSYKQALEISPTNLQAQNALNRVEVREE